MCTSVPQIPVRSTLTSTSLTPISGVGTSSSQRPGWALLFTSAFIAMYICLQLRQLASGRGQSRWQPKCLTLFLDEFDVMRDVVDHRRQELLERHGPSLAVRAHT